MKKLIAGYDGGNIRYVISEDGEPYAAGVYTSKEAMAGDVVLAVCRENSRSSGGFFADAGLGRTDFIAKTPGELKPGDKFPASIVTGPRGRKGRLLSRDFSFCGFYVFANFKTAPSSGSNATTGGFSVTVSKKIRDAEEVSALSSAATSLLETFKCPYFAEITFRTAACGNTDAAVDELKDFLTRTADIGNKMAGLKGLNAGSLLFKNSFPDFILATYRDNVFESVLTDGPELSLLIKKRFKNAPFKPEIRTHTGTFSIFDTDEGARKLPDYMGRRFYTKSGAEIVYDETEAMHVFDINSAGSKKSASEINLEACEEIARFISVRNIAGIIMCDFIGTGDKSAMNSVVEKMRELAKKDYARFEVFGFTKLEILECSRSRKLK